MKTGRPPLAWITGVAIGAMLSLACLTDPASAQITHRGYVALAWQDCYGDGGSNVRQFACNTNSGTEVLVVSIVPSIDIPQFNGMTVTLDLVSPEAALPSWWQLQVGGCRAQNLVVSIAPPSSALSCQDPWQGQGAPGSIAQPTFSPKWTRIKGTCGLSTPVAIAAGQETFMCSFVIRNGKTTGTGSCSGCSSGACLGVCDVYVTQPLGAGDYHFDVNLPNNSSDFVSWQSDLVLPYTYCNSPNSCLNGAKSWSACVDATTAGRPTWGSIKRLYR